MKVQHRISVGESVSLAISTRANGLSIEVSPTSRCNLACVYCLRNCQNNSTPDVSASSIKEQVARALNMLPTLRTLPEFADYPDRLLELQHVCIAGLGEPTLNPEFETIIENLVHLRALGDHCYFKIVIATNGTQLLQDAVQRALAHLPPTDEIWIKLDGGTQQYTGRLSGPNYSLNEVTRGIQCVGRKRPVVIQSMFPVVDEVEPSEFEIEQYIERLNEFQRDSVQIKAVQIFSATSAGRHSRCRHLPLKRLSAICRRVHSSTGLMAEVF